MLYTYQQVLHLIENDEAYKIEGTYRKKEGDKRERKTDREKERQKEKERKKESIETRQ